MKRYIAGVVTGLVLSGSIAFAVNYTATDNPFPIQLNGENIELEGYNIDGSTYFKLRDIADKVGGFSVDFQNNTIQLAKDGYVYDNEPSVDYSKYIGTYSIIGGSLGFHWTLSILSINEDEVEFEFSYEKPGSSYVIDSAKWVSNAKAIASGQIVSDYDGSSSPVSFTLDFADDGINCTIDDNGYITPLSFSFLDMTE